MLVQVCGFVTNNPCFKSPFTEYHTVKSKNNLASVFIVLDKLSH